MRNDLAPDLFTVADLLDADECRRLIDRGEALGFEAASVATPTGPKMMANVRNNDRATLDDPALAARLWEWLAPHVPAAVGDAVAVGLNDRLKFYRYDAAQRFNAHRDGVVARSPTERSRLTFLVYLNGDDEGGQTAFYSEDRVGGLRRLVASVDPRAGMGLVFAHAWCHEGTRVTAGRKYVLRRDVMYRDR